VKKITVIKKNRVGLKTGLKEGSLGPRALKTKKARGGKRIAPQLEHGEKP